ncbi:hypothetical protein KIL84_014003 [Mauremys mutica]|uniref:Uncharacterized protein n=1 Tax=Mauremys mutica TaxID=74926 RepID=A0A9D3WYZ9_9SAUR|nr:hypothetical protein KIL84_014003 [Mauremys mutica]
MGGARYNPPRRQRVRGHWMASGFALSPGKQLLDDRSLQIQQLSIPGGHWPVTLVSSIFGAQQLLVSQGPAQNIVLFSEGSLPCCLQCPLLLHPSQFLVTGLPDSPSQQPCLMSTGTVTVTWGHT